MNNDTQGFPGHKCPNCCHDRAYVLQNFTNQYVVQCTSCGQKSTYDPIDPEIKTGRLNSSAILSPRLSCSSGLVIYRDPNEIERVTTPITLEILTMQDLRDDPRVSTK
jgi:hypothetical protein